MCTVLQFFLMYHCSILSLIWLQSLSLSLFLSLDQLNRAMGGSSSINSNAKHTLSSINQVTGQVYTSHFEQSPKAWRFSMDRAEAPSVVAQWEGVSFPSFRGTEHFGCPPKRNFQQQWKQPIGTHSPEPMQAAALPSSLSPMHFFFIHVPHAAAASAFVLSNSKAVVPHLFRPALIVLLIRLFPVIAKLHPCWY